jgi:hypothetical protein
MNVKREGNSVLLCCGKGRCPALKKSEDQEEMYSLTDDFGGQVLLSKEQLTVIQEALEELDNS